MSTTSQRVRIPHPWREGTVEGVEVDREPRPSFNDTDAERVKVELKGAPTPFIYSAEEVEAL